MWRQSRLERMVVFGHDGRSAGVHDVGMVQDRHSVDGLDGAYRTHWAKSILPILPPIPSSPVLFLPHKA